MKEKILMIAERIPFPSNNGGKLRTANIMIHLSKRYDVDFITYAQEAATQEQMDQMDQYCANVFVFPEGKPSLKKHLKFLLTGKSGITCSIYSKNMQAKIYELCDENRYKMVWVERLFCMPYVQKLKQAYLPIVLNMHDVDHEAVLFFSKVDVSLVKRIYFRLEYYRVLVLEKRSFHLANTIIACSNRDKELYVKQFQFSQGKWLTANNGVDLSIAQKLPQHTRQPATILFVGGLDNPCNRQGLLWYFKEVWPIVAQTKHDAKCIVAGSGESAEEVSTVAKQTKNVEFLGNVDDVYTLYQDATCIIVPLHSGSGTRLKIVEAFSFHLPVISTSIGAEGIPVKNGEDIIISDTPAGFAQGILKVLDDSALKNRLTTGGYEIAQKFFDWNLIMDKLLSEVEKTL